MRLPSPGFELAHSIPPPIKHANALDRSATLRGLTTTFKLIERDARVEILSTV